MTTSLKSAKSNKNDINQEFRSHKARIRSNFSCHESQVLFGKKLEIAKQLRARGARYTAQFLARHRTLPELEMMLKTF